MTLIRFARLLHWLFASLVLVLATVTAALSGMEPDLGRSAAMLWFVTTPLLVLFAGVVMAGVK